MSIAKSLIQFPRRVRGVSIHKHVTPNGVKVWPLHYWLSDYKSNERKRNRQFGIFFRKYYPQITEQAIDRGARIRLVSVRSAASASPGGSMLRILARMFSAEWAPHRAPRKDEL